MELIFESLCTSPKDCIEVDICLNMECSFHCPYCYARKEQKDHWGEEWTWEQAKYVYKTMSMSHIPVALNILGGEPTEYKYLNDFLELCYQDPKYRQVAIFTNADKDLRFVTYNKKLTYLLAYHPVNVNDDRFIKNVEYLLSIGIKPVVSVLLYQNKKFYNKIINFYHKIKDYPVNFEFKHVFDDERNVNIDFNITGDDEELRYVYKGKRVTIKEIQENGYDRFKGCYCNMNHLDIEIDGSIIHGCKYSDHSHNVFKEPFYFKHLKDTMVVCDKEKCYNYCWYDFSKYKP